jgi:hypothetical protein
MVSGLPALVFDQCAAFLQYADVTYVLPAVLIAVSLAYRADDDRYGDGGPGSRPGDDSDDAYTCRCKTVHRCNGSPIPC